MTIKDVEKLTGLTAKSIRYYENKGLLTVERNEENDYRSYSETEVNRLKKIKLFRYLEFSVEEVRAMLDMETKEIQKVLEQKAEQFSDLRDRCKDKQELCLCLVKDYKKSEAELNVIISEYNQYAQTIESDEMAEITENLKDLGTPSFSIMFLYTLMFSGPILALFIQISDGKLEDLALVAGIAIISTMLITGVWIFYFVQRSKNKNRVKRKNRATIWIIPLLILALILGIASIVGVDSLIQKYLIAKDFLFYTYSAFVQKGLIVIVMLTIMVGGCLLIGKFSGESRKQMEHFGVFAVWDKLGKWKPLVLGALCVAYYCFVTSFTVVTEDAIICHSPIHPMGVTYSYSDVDKITAGVGQKDFTYFQHERKGQFYYKIELDGKEIVFINAETSNSEIERYNEHTYLWLEEFDQKLVELGVQKESDSTGYEAIQLDQEYVDRFHRILENK